MSYKSFLRGFLAFFLCLQLQQGYTQDTLAHEARTNRRWLYTAAGTYTVGMGVLSVMWYRNMMSPNFHTFNDNNQWCGLDKLGHAFTTYQIADAIFPRLATGPYSRSKQIFLSASVAALAMLPIEVLDGFSKNYGASTGDALANTTGAILWAAQQLTSCQKYIHYKYSYWPTQWAAQRPNVLGASQAERWLKDYNGQTYWLSFDMYRFGHRKFLGLKFINLALGYGADQMLYGSPQENTAAGFLHQKQWYIGLDWNLSHIKTERRALKWLIKASEVIKLPMPALRWQGQNTTLVFL